MKYESFTEMPVWKKAFQLMLKIYQITKTFPSDERFGLISEMRPPIQWCIILPKDLVASTREKPILSDFERK